VPAVFSDAAEIGAAMGTADSDAIGIVDLMAGTEGWVKAGDESTEIRIGEGSCSMGEDRGASSSLIGLSKASRNSSISAFVTPGAEARVSLDVPAVTEPKTILFHNANSFAAPGLFHNPTRSFLYAVKLEP
jgi:hypothetical protein